MIDCIIHYRASGSERQRLACLPRQAEFITHEGKVWKVDAVVHSTPSTTWGRVTVDVYALAVADDRASELETIWATWSMKANA